MTIKPGTLVYDKESGRYDIRSGLNEYYGAYIADRALKSLTGSIGSLPVSKWICAGTGIWWVSTPTI